MEPDILVREVTGRTRNREQDRTVSEPAVAEVFDRLACPDGLTALGGQLAGATRVELEDLTDRFLAERAVAVVAERALEERRWSTPKRLAVEQQLVASAVSPAGEQAAVVSHQAVRAALHAHPTAGEDQQAMVRGPVR